MAYDFLSEFIVLRTPINPFVTLSLSQDTFDQNIANLLYNNIFREALYLSSPNLLIEVEKYFKNTLDSKEKEKLELSVYRYYLRAFYRCTPFGIFAGISLGTISDSTLVQLQAITQYRKNTRLDTHFLSSFVQEILKDSAVRDSIKWYANTTSYAVGEKLRYVEFRIDKDSRSHHLTHVDNSEYVQTILDKAQRGATTTELAYMLVGSEINLEEATGFIHEMISGCLLVSELEPLVTGVEYHHQLVEKLKKVPAANEHLQKLLSVIERLNKADKQGAGVSTDFYNQIILDVRGWQIDFEPGRLFQCDLLKPTEHCQISHTVTDELNKTVAFLDKITIQPEQTNLLKFKEEFEKRYESQEIPLLTVLDADTGIGYPVNEQAHADNTPVLRNLFLNNVVQNQSIAYPNTKWTKFLLQKFQELTKSTLTEIVITDHEVKEIFRDAIGGLSFPDSAYTMCSILASSGEAVDNGNFLISHEVTAGPSAANLLGRFCYMDEELTRLTRDILEKEEQAKPDCVFAEILHIAQARLGNILMRPILRKYEIPILTPPAVDEEHTIALSDLMVSVRNGRFFLRSKRLNKGSNPSAYNSA